MYTAWYAIPVTVEIDGVCVKSYISIVCWHRSLRRPGSPLDANVRCLYSMGTGAENSCRPIFQNYKILLKINARFK
jgi:hypothetical protein